MKKFGSFVGSSNADSSPGWRVDAFAEDDVEDFGYALFDGL